MPTYEYVCTSCDHGFEIVQSMSEDSLVDCPECGRPDLRKVFNAPGISFKGSGFYKTDSRGSSGSGSSSNSDSSSSSSSGSDSSASSSSASSSGSGSSGSGTSSSE